MYIEGNSIRIDPEQTTLQLEEEEWLFRTTDGSFEHLPTHISFSVELDADVDREKSLTLLDFSAKPVHICAGRVLPNFDVIKELGQCAIFLHLQIIGLVKPDRPEHVDQKREADLRMN